jgi:hypothetical protein
VYGKSWSSLGRLLDPITQDACQFYEDHVVISAQGGRSCSTSRPARRWRRTSPKGKAAIHQNHGLFTVGETVEEAAFWLSRWSARCQAQLMAEAVGTPKHIPHEMATYNRQNTASRSPAGSASSPSGKRSAGPTLTSSTERAAPSASPASRLTLGPVASSSSSAPSPQYSGAIIAKNLFDDAAPATIGWFRVIGAVLVLAPFTVYALAALDRRDYLVAALFGSLTAGMKHLLLRRDRPLARSANGVAIEFIGRSPSPRSRPQPAQRLRTRPGRARCGAAVGDRAR